MSHKKEHSPRKIKINEEDSKLEKNCNDILLKLLDNKTPSWKHKQFDKNYVYNFFKLHLFYNCIWVWLNISVEKSLIFFKLIFFFCNICFIKQKCLISNKIIDKTKTNTRGESYKKMKYQQHK